MHGHEAAAPVEIVARNLAHERHFQVRVRVDTTGHNELARGIDDLGP